MSNPVNLYKDKHMNYLFQSMALTAEESNSLALSWLETHNNTFYGFLDGGWLNKKKIEDMKSEVVYNKISDNFKGKHLCDVYAHGDTLLQYAAESSATGFQTWSSLCATSRSKILYNVAQTIKKNEQLFAIIDALTTAKHLYKAKKDVTNLIESFNYYAGCVLRLDDISVSKTFHPTGPVCIIADEYNTPSLPLSLRVCSTLASGNSVLILTDARFSLTAFLLAEICFNSGIPAGVLNVIPTELEYMQPFGKLDIFSKFIFTGTLEKSMIFSEYCSKVKMPCDFLIPRRPVVIVYENADLHSAANGVIESFLYYDIRSQSSGCKVMIQESIHEKFIKILWDRFQRIKVGNNFTKTDISCLSTAPQKGFLKPLVKETIQNCGHMTLHLIHPLQNYMTWMPVLFTRLQSNSRLALEELGGPIGVSVCFRTVKESISMFNCDNKGSPVSIWTENISVALEAAKKLKSGVIWINSENVIHPKTAFTGVYLSGNSVEGGQDGFFSHMSHLSKQDRMNKMCNSVHFPFSESPLVEGDKKEYKLYIGGSETCSSKNTVIFNESTVISSGTKSDVQMAVSSALAAQPSWEASTDLQKRKVFLDIIEHLIKSKAEYVAELQQLTKSPEDVSQKEVDDALATLYYWMAKIDKNCGLVQEINNNLTALQNRKPLGVIGVQCPDEKPLLSFVSLVIPAIVYGNTVVAIASSCYPTLALKLCKIFTAAKVPGGVINVIWGDTPYLVAILRKHADVNSVWHTDMPSEVIYGEANVSQRLFHCSGIWDVNNEAKLLKFTIQSTYTKSIFLPSGEIFAN